MFRPQFFYETPEGAKDVPFVRPFNTTLTVPVGQVLRGVIVRFDYDAPQFIRSLFIEGAQQGQTQNLQVSIKDAYGNELTDGFVPLWLFGVGSGVTPPDGGSGRTKVFESELRIPPGGFLEMDFYAPA